MSIKDSIKQRVPKSVRVKLRALLPGLVERRYKAYREKRIKKESPHINRERIATDLRNLGLEKGDTVLLHSSLKSIGYVEGGPITVIEALLGVLSKKGTLMVPTYTLIEGSMYKTCTADDYIFDPKTSKTQLGAIPSTFLKLPGIERSIHPTHSVSAIGENAKYVVESHHLAQSTFGIDSPWDRLMKLNGKLLMIGLGMGRNTISHVLEDNLEDRFPLPVRMEKTFRVKCRDWDGSIIQVGVNPLDPKYIEHRMDQPARKDLRDYFWHNFVNAGILNVGKIGRAASWTANAKAYYQHLEGLMELGVTIYTRQEELQAMERSRRGS